jgi:hypothetical protein
MCDTETLLSPTISASDAKIGLPRGNTFPESCDPQELKAQCFSSRFYPAYPLQTGWLAT